MSTALRIAEAVTLFVFELSFAAVVGIFALLLVERRKERKEAEARARAAVAAARLADFTDADRVFLAELRITA